MAKCSVGDSVQSRHGLSMTVRFVGGAGRTSADWPDASGLTGGSGLMGIGLMGVIGWMMCCPGWRRTDGGGFDMPGTGNTGAIPG